MDEASVPCFARGVKFRHDDVRQRWVILAPERALLPDATAVEILHRIDGIVELSCIIDDLALVFAAPRALIARDVLTMARELMDSGILRDLNDGQRPR